MIEMSNIRSNSDDGVQQSTKDPPKPTPTYEKQEKRLRWLLKMYFYVPIKWKHSTLSIHGIYFIFFIIQIVKLSLLTSQMYLYGNDRARFNSVVRRGHLTLRHLLLENWDASWETIPYPPAHGDFAVYTIPDLESGINFAVTRYYNAERDAIGYYVRTESDSMEARVKYFDFPGFHDTNVENGIKVNEKYFQTKLGLRNQTVEGEKVYNYSISDELEFLNISQPMKRMLTTTLEFSIHSVRPNENTKHALCLRINGEVTFKDINNNGQVNVDLETHTRKINCEAINIAVEDLVLEDTSKALGRAVVAFCVLSIITSALTVLFGIFVFFKTKRFMKDNFKQFYGLSETSEEIDLPRSEYFRFFWLGFWNIPLLLSDVFTIHGTHWILIVNERESELELSLLDSYTVIIGAGCILAWFSLLRYFKVNEKFHLLFSTLARAIGDVIAYMVCVTVMFVGFWICGYVVLGPYHVKFQTPSRAAETLFALVNGDEIFATIAILEADQVGSDIVSWFARCYIIIYVSIYTIVVINLLIALFMSAYETIKNKPEDQTLEPMEQAIQNFIQQQSGKNLRSSFYDLLNVPGGATEEELGLREKLRRIMRLNEVTKDVEILKPRTLKTFIREKEERKAELDLFCCKLSLSLFKEKD